VTITLKTCGSSQTVAVQNNLQALNSIGPLTVRGNGLQDTQAQGKFIVSNSECPIQKFTLQTETGLSRGNNSFIGVEAKPDQNGVLQPTLFINPGAVFDETVRIVATINGGSSAYIKLRVFTCSPSNT
jgi:hypothetical protein